MTGKSIDAIMRKKEYDRQRYRMKKYGNPNHVIEKKTNLSLAGLAKENDKKIVDATKKLYMRNLRQTEKTRRFIRDVTSEIAESNGEEITTKTGESINEKVDRLYSKIKEFHAMVMAL